MKKIIIVLIASLISFSVFANINKEVLVNHVEVGNEI